MTDILTVEEFQVFKDWVAGKLNSSLIHSPPLSKRLDKIVYTIEALQAQIEGMRSAFDLFWSQAKRSGFTKAGSNPITHTFHVAMSDANIKACEEAYARSAADWRLKEERSQAIAAALRALIENAPCPQIAFIGSGMSEGQNQQLSQDYQEALNQGTKALEAWEGGK